MKSWYFSALWGIPPIIGGIPSKRVSNAEFWCFLSCTSQQTFEQTMEWRLIWDARTLMWRHCNDMASNTTMHFLYLNTMAKNETGFGSIWLSKVFTSERKFSIYIAISHWLTPCLRWIENGSRNTSFSLYFTFSCNPSELYYSAWFRRGENNLVFPG